MGPISKGDFQRGKIKLKAGLISEVSGFWEDLDKTWKKSASTNLHGRPRL